MPDDRFDPLTPDTELYADHQQAIYVTFWPASFTLSLFPSAGKRQPSFVLPYDKSLFEILDSLESGFVTPSLLCLVQKMNFNEWDRGEILVHITDCRFSEHRNFHHRLSIGSEVLDYEIQRLLNNAPIKQQLEFERQALLLLHPEICVDRSPSVAKFQSLIDWRQKMWMPRGARLLHESPQTPPPTPTPTPVLPRAHQIVKPEYKKIELPDKFRKLFQEVTDHHKKTQPP
jgi:hypothetical protein